MQHLRKHFLKTMRFLLLVACGLSMLTACGAKKMGGSFTGKAKAELRVANDYMWDTLTDSSSDVLAILTHDGKEVTLRFGNTALLEGCEIKARDDGDGSATIEGGAVCETAVDGVSRTVTVKSGEIYVSGDAGGEVSITVRGSSRGFSDDSPKEDIFDIKFDGKSPK